MNKFIELKQGTTRIVVCIGKYAIKIPNFRSWKLFLNGLLANIQEETFRDLDPILLKSKLYIPGGFLSIFEKVEEIDEITWIKIKDDFYTIIDKKDYIIPVEIKKDSFGMLNGQLKIIDYG